MANEPKNGGGTAAKLAVRANIVPGADAAQAAPPHQEPAATREHDAIARFIARHLRTLQGLSKR